VPVAEGGGYGRKTIEQICQQVQVPVGEGLARLKAHGIEAAAGDNVREAAQRHGKQPIELVKVIQGQ
ncbi:MAG TPA: hypothetical protein VK911_06360, partial [Vicinamibacterales bacterium]|nr:hypothetical protein [Vicinamibacterales bacterium]